MPNDADDQALARAMALLTEHFPNAVVLVSRVNDAGQTESWTRWEGNWHACIGHAREWLIKKDAESRAEARRRADEDEGD